ncbi:MAG TPA: hypothetical protein VNZ52_04005 [Candidatus Thermoplasmatota archaeon]|nr:hypothetical protein [Candidatus Thermoplasmatota archaeon]
MLPHRPLVAYAVALSGAVLLLTGLKGWFLMELMLLPAWAFPFVILAVPPLAILLARATRARGLPAAGLGFLAWFTWIGVLALTPTGGEFEAILAEVPVPEGGALLSSRSNLGVPFSQGWGSRAYTYPAGTNATQLLAETEARLAQEGWEVEAVVPPTAEWPEGRIEARWGLLDLHVTVGGPDPKATGLSLYLTR